MPEACGKARMGRARAVTPAQVFAANTMKRSGELTVDPHGGVTGTLQIVMTGQEALLWRQTALKSTRRN